MPPEKRTRTRKARGGRKGGASEGGRKAARRVPPLSLLVVWVLAVILLASLIYLGRGTRRLPPPPETEPARKAAPTAQAPPSQTSQTGRTAPVEAHGTTVVREVPQPVERPPVKKTESRPETAGTAPAPAEIGDVKVAMVPPAPRPEPPSPNIAPKVARVAIVIDDLGPDLNIARQFAALPFPVTLSVLPEQAHSREIAEMAHAEGREVILHLPMEAINPRENPGRGALMLSMSGDQIRRLIGTDLDTSPYFDGVNNHMGSRVTGDAAMMHIILAELKGRNLFFLDSVTTGDSKGWKVARELKMPALKRDIFLDNDRSPDAIRSQIARLARVAEVKGTALAIGHPHESTLKSLREAAGYFRREGLDVVAARDLVVH